MSQGLNSEISHWIEGLALNPGASEELIQEIQHKLGMQLPTDYLRFIRWSNGAEGPIGEQAYLALWPLEEIPILNDAHHVTEFAPFLLLFGSNGGGEVYAFDRTSAALPIVAVPEWPMALSLTYPCGDTFFDFLKFLYNRKYEG